MNTVAFEKAKGRLRSAQRALKLMQEQTVEGAFEEHWIDFLVHWKGAYTKVQQAAKDTPREKQWFGGVNAERRGDPLLQFLFEARNDEEHGVIQSATAKPARAVIQATKDAASAQLVIRDGNIVDVVDADGESVAVIYQRTAQESGLSPVKDRGRKTIPVPTSHLGTPIEPHPHIVAKLGLKWLEDLVAVAEAMQ